MINCGLGSGIYHYIFRKKKWTVRVVSLPAKKSRTLLERILLMFCFDIKRRLVRDHPLYTGEGISNNQDDYVLVISSENIGSVGFNELGSNYIMSYQIGAKRLGNRYNYFTILDVITRGSGLTPVSLFITDKNTEDTIYYDEAQTSSELYSPLRNFKKSGYLLHYLFDRIARDNVIKPNKCFVVNNVIGLPEGRIVIGFVKLLVRYLSHKVLTSSVQKSWKSFMGINPNEPIDKLDLSLIRWSEFSPYTKGDVADPFIFKLNGSTAIFFEYIPFRSRKGEIHVSTIDSEMNIIQTERILNENYHLAYPFLFEHEDVLYMIPDSGSNLSVDLYSCEVFPFKWKHKRRLFDNMKMSDCTIVEHSNMWWMFCNVQENANMSSWDHLYIYYTDDPIEGEWSAHKLNPVISDASQARPAGRIYKEGEYLIRPSQNSAFSYGYGLNLNRIEILTVDEYEEVIIKSFIPWSEEMKGIHTFNFNDEYILIDKKVRGKN